MADEKQKHLVFSILEFLQTSLNNGTIKQDDSEGIEGTFFISWQRKEKEGKANEVLIVALFSHILLLLVAIQCIGEAFGVDLNDAAQAQAYSTKPATLVSIFDVFVNAQKKLGNKVRTLLCIRGSCAPLCLSYDSGWLEDMKNKDNKIPL